MTFEQKIRLKNRFQLCEKEIQRAKHALTFWSQELGYVANALADDKQFNFNDVLSKENQNA